MEIGFIGLGKLGSECAEVMAEKHNVIGYDIADVAPEGVAMTNNIYDTVIDKKFTFIAVQTPHDPDYDGRIPTSNFPAKDFDYSHVVNILKELSMVDYNSTIVLISTVLPGTIRREFQQYLKPGQFIYNPYLIAMGTVKDDMRNPEMTIIGVEKEYGNADELINFYKTLCNCDRYVVGSWDDAEAIKIFYNTFISMKISLTNMVLDVAEKNGNMDATFIMEALANSTKRIISPMYMKPGMGDGGPCHPRDNIALSSLSQRLDLGYDLFNSIMHTREEQARNLATKLISYNQPVVILGKSYKPNVTFTDGSYSILVGYFVQMEGYDLFYDETPTNYKPEQTFTYLLGHRHRYYNYPFRKSSVIIDPWCECPDIEECEVIYYGKPNKNKAR